ncbi:MAG: hypothetical protein WCT02_04835, partial [Candidatus Paceibacterota bacterium]
PSRYIFHFSIVNDPYVLELTGNRPYPSIVTAGLKVFIALKCPYLMKNSYLLANANKIPQ